jgi:hypothetical protein
MHRDDCFGFLTNRFPGLLRVDIVSILAYIRKNGTITSSPSPIPIAFRLKNKASVAELSPTPN